MQCRNNLVLAKVANTTGPVGPFLQKSHKS